MQLQGMALCLPNTSHEMTGSTKYYVYREKMLLASALLILKNKAVFPLRQMSELSSIIFIHEKNQWKVRSKQTTS